MSQKPRLPSSKAVADFFNTKVKVAKPAPKFEIGDYIINTKYKVISKVLNIIGIFDNEDRTVNYEAAQYVLVDFKNDSRDNFMAGVDKANGSWGPSMSGPALAHTAKREYKRYKPVHAIDAYYNKINPAAAHALYGIKVTNGDKSGNDDQCD